MNPVATPTAALSVGNVAPECSEQLLRTAFGCFGAIVSCVVQPDRSRALLTFASVAAATAARHGLQGKCLGGQALTIEYAAALLSPAGGVLVVPRSTPAVLSAPPGAVGAGGGPVPTEPPHDLFARMVIDKFAEAYLRHGPHLADLARCHHPTHPHLQFLHGPSRPGFHYYHWRIHCLRAGMGDEQAAQAVASHQMHTHRPPPPAGPDLPMGPSAAGPDYFQTLEQPDGLGLNCVECLETLSVVCRLTESRDVLRAAAAWVVSLQAKARYGIHVFEQAMYDPAIAAAPERKLLLVFVLSDIVYACAKRSTEEEAQAFDAVLVFMPRFVLTALSYQPLPAIDKIGKVVGLWAAKGFFEEDVLTALREGLDSARRQWADQQQQQDHPPVPHPGSPPPPYAAFATVYAAAAAVPAPGASPGAPPDGAYAEPPPPPPVTLSGRPEEWLSAGYFAGLQRSVDSPYTALNPALAPKAIPPVVTPNVALLPKQVRAAVEVFYRALHPHYGVDTPANVRDFALPSTAAAPPAAGAAPADPFRPPQPLAVGSGRLNGA